MAPSSLDGKRGSIQYWPSLPSIGREGKWCLTAPSFPLMGKEGGIIFIALSSALDGKEGGLVFIALSSRLEKRGIVYCWPPSFPAGMRGGIGFYSLLLSLDGKRGGCFLIIFLFFLFWPSLLQKKERGLFCVRSSRPVLSLLGLGCYRGPDRSR